MNRVVIARVVGQAGIAVVQISVVLIAAVLLAGLPVAASAAAAQAAVRAQRDTVGFAVSTDDFQAVLAASLAAEGLPAPNGAADDRPAIAAILPHDDYLYAGRTAVHALPALQAKRWIVFGVCHACRRVGVRDRLLLDDSVAWRVAGRDWPVDTGLRADLLARLGDVARVDPERHAVEHSIEALLPWLGAAVAEPTFVPILVSGMELDTLRDQADAVAVALADICRERGWAPGRDLGLLISADAVHYGCEGWGGNGYAPFGCDAAGHAAARAQDVTLADACLAGPVDDAAVATFTRLVWDPQHPDYPAYPYRITWCGLYSIPFGLTVAARLQEALGLPPLAGEVLRYGDSVSDGRLDVTGTRLGVTAPNTLGHWVGYATAVYRAAAR